MPSSSLLRPRPWGPSSSPQTVSRRASRPSAWCLPGSRLETSGPAASPCALPTALQADDVANTVVSWFMDDHAEAEVFNRLVDPAAVTSVAVVLGETGETVELLPTV